MVKKARDMNSWVLGDSKRLLGHYQNVQQSWISPNTKGLKLDEFGVCGTCGGKVLKKELHSFGGNCGSCAGF